MKKWFLWIILLHSILAQSQKSAPDTAISLIRSDTLAPSEPFKQFQQNHRKLMVTGLHTTAYAGTLILLSQTWYKDYPKAPFHTFNDSKEWLQVDKIGHAWTTYNIAKYSSDLWKWSGFTHRQSVLLGGISGLGYQTILEVLDAHSAEWGWSWSDVGANALGAGLFTFQELAWQEQRVQFKFSSHPVRHAGALKQRVDQLFGSSFPELLLKDYNGQTYWLSFNLKSFSRECKWPAWLNVAVGYGAQGLYGGFSNIATDKSGNITFDGRGIDRQRQWYISPDIDFTKIKTKKMWVRSTLSVLNMLKFPAPALEYSKGKLNARLFYF